MKSRLIVAAIGVPLTLVFLVVLPEWGTLVFAAAISALGAHEMCSAAGVGRAAAVCAMISALGVCVLAYFALLLPFAALGAVYVFAVFFIWVRRYEKELNFGVSGLGAALMAGLVVPCGLSALILIRNGANGRWFVLLPIIISFVSDGGAYFVGRAMGKHKFSPRTSPKKSVEGAVGGLVIGAVFTAVYAGILIWQLGDVFGGMSAACAVCAVFVASAAVGAVSELGDLAFSLIKRELGIKDYGKLLPGHGGALDRFDSMVFSAPAVALLLALVK